jgi:DNA-binding SARP family transcriptional activator
MKAEIEFTLLGKFAARRSGTAVLDHAGRKVQELVAYILLHPNRQHRREAIASVLWPDSDREQSLKNLRQTLWLLHRELPPGPKGDSLLVQEGEWLGIGSLEGIWVDAIAFEDAYRKGVAGIKDEEPFATAVKLYRGSLLEGWYNAWCTGERERFREMYFSLLAKLMQLHEARKEYDIAIAYGTLALQQDPAKEVVHRMLMKLRYLMGDRTGALRQFERCKEALLRELDVEPAEETVTLYEEIRSDRRGSIQAETGPHVTPSVSCKPRESSRRVISAPSRNSNPCSPLDSPYWLRDARRHS